MSGERKFSDMDFVLALNVLRSDLKFLDRIQMPEWLIDIPVEAMDAYWQ
jgi:hypothetical protein